MPIQMLEMLSVFQISSPHVCKRARFSGVVTFPPESICYVLGLIVQWVDISCLAGKCHQPLLELPGILVYRFYRPALDEARWSAVIVLADWG